MQKNPIFLTEEEVVERYAPAYLPFGWLVASTAATVRAARTAQRGTQLLSLLCVDLWFLAWGSHG